VPQQLIGGTAPADSRRATRRSRGRWRRAGTTPPCSIGVRRTGDYGGGGQVGMQGWSGGVLGGRGRRGRMARDQASEGRSESVEREEAEATGSS
jgi:hypothetical protein